MSFVHKRIVPGATLSSLEEDFCSWLSSIGGEGDTTTEGVTSVDAVVEVETEEADEEVDADGGGFSCGAEGGGGTLSPVWNFLPLSPIIEFLWFEEDDEGEDCMVIYPPIN